MAGPERQLLLKTTGSSVAPAHSIGLITPPFVLAQMLGGLLQLLVKGIRAHVHRTLCLAQ
jgi:hypothetical protein